MQRWDLGEEELVAAAADSVRQLDAALHRAVERARAGGLSWEQIAGALGIARQSAWRRFKEGTMDREAEVKSRVCNFCGEPYDKVETLIAAKTGACICGECVQLASQIIGWKVVEQIREKPQSPVASE